MGGIGKLILTDKLYELGDNGKLDLDNLDYEKYI